MSRMIKVVANDGQEVDDNAHNINIEILWNALNSNIEMVRVKGIFRDDFEKIQNYGKFPEFREQGKLWPKLHQKKLPRVL